MDYIDLIKEIRVQNKMSQRQVARELNIAPSTYSDIENRKIKLSTEDFIRICKLFNISPNVLINDPETINVALTKNDIINLINVKSTIDKMNKQINYNTISNQNITIGDNNSNINFGIINKEEK